MVITKQTEEFIATSLQSKVSGTLKLFNE